MKLLVAPFPTPRCSSYWKGSLRVPLDYNRQLYFYNFVFYKDDVCIKYKMKVDMPLKNKETKTKVAETYRLIIDLCWHHIGIIIFTRIE